MTDKHDDGGPAMPVTRNQVLCEWCAEETGAGGMSMLDVAAIEIVAQLAAVVMNRWWWPFKPPPPKSLAGAAYDLAAALVAEKRRRVGGTP